MDALIGSGLFFLSIALLFSAFILVSVRIYVIKPDFVFKILRYTLLLVFWLVFCIGAIGIGIRISSRHTESYSRSLESVNKIWGGNLSQNPPSLTFEANGIREYENKTTGQIQTQTTIVEKGLNFEEQTLNLELSKNIRQKGLLIFPGYNLDFTATYSFKNTTNISSNIIFRMPLPLNAGNITDIQVELDGKPYAEDTNLADGIEWIGKLNKNEVKQIKVHYKAQGTKSFYYNLGQQQTEIKKFKTILNTDYTDTIIPDNAMAPSTTNSDSKKTNLEWIFSNLVTGQNIGIEVDVSGNYGKVASKLFFYSPLSMLLFLISVLVFVVVKQVKIHPINYLFLLASFFIFYLLGSYLMSYLNVIIGIFISLAISTAILVYYTILIKKGSELVKNVTYSALIFQWFFSLAFFFPEHTGLLITIAAIVSFVGLISYTADTDWENKF
jgi:hypothetical protein